MNKIKLFDEYRTYLFAIAYRMLGTVMDAEDMVQEAYLRWQQTDAAEVDSPKSYLATIVTRLSIDQLRSARVKREMYMGEWLPEPILMEGAPLSEEMAILSESVSMAFLVLLESLSPMERAAFLLREVFDYSYGEVAEIVGKEEANCRQMVSRARRHLRQGRPRFQTTLAEQEQITWQFAQACMNGDMGGLLAVLAEDVVEYSDGGGKVRAAINPIYGADKVARFFLGILKKAPDGIVPRMGVVNAQPAIISYLEGRATVVTVLDIENGRIQRIYNVVNPDKLQHIKPLA